MSSRERRPNLAAFAKRFKRPTVESRVGISIGPREWTHVQKHRKWPGHHATVHKEQVFWQRIKMDNFGALLRHLDVTGTLQRYAFGQELLNICNHERHMEIDNVKRLKKCQVIAKDFILLLDAEVQAEEAGSMLSSHKRCQCVEFFTIQRCLQSRGHNE
uniref:Uncharacterized protein n=1 Tax=Odontella aurita TaxID=265563 RepID=A0A6U6DNC1_9STRA|mmetsp:Transcript_21321/g.62071  ORF Transcript_21321/g.62071 Transcript_21321/m.62071 type:complete len:159 (+) Transcript_21321:870-1346(+)